MLKKRLIFTLLFSEGKFSLSRNFRLQEVGDIEWLEKNYNFSQISHAIDELVIIDVSRSHFESEEFCKIVKLLTKGCFVPITIGGKIDSLKKAKEYLNSGADKILINSILFKNKELVQDLSEEFGEQCLVAAVDIKQQASAYTIFTDQGTSAQPGTAEELIENILAMPVGELLINSIDRDGTGNGLDFEILKLLPKSVHKPIIFSGGIGNFDHLYFGFENTRVDAIATANLLNFVGDGLIESRKSLIDQGIPLPLWDNNFYNTIGQKFSNE
jgi:cyclase